MPEALNDLVSQQSGVIARRQLHMHGWTSADVQRELRRRSLVRMLPGVFVNHTGQPTWLQRAWAGVLYYSPAVLSGESALRVENGPGWASVTDSTIRVGVDHQRRVKPMPGYVVDRFVELESRARWNTSPPRMRLEEAVLDVAARATGDLAALEVLAAACRWRRTTPDRLLVALSTRTRVRRRRWLEASLSDLRDGSCSVLESGYLHNVERAHGLPRGTRQAAAIATSGRVYRDVDYEEFGLIVELDGLLFHDGPVQRNRDLARDLDAAAAGLTTVRLGWEQSYDSACLTAIRIGELLRSRGWTGSPVACGRGCPLEKSQAG